MSSRNTAPVIRPDESIATISAFLRSLAADAYFGRVELSFQSGHVTNIRQEQNLKTSDLSNLVANSKGCSDGNNAQ